MSGTLATGTMSPSRLARQASIAVAVSVHRYGTWRTSGHRDDQEARRRSRLRLHTDGGRLGHLLPPLAGGERRVRYAARRAVRELREGHGPPPRQAAGGESQPGLRELRDLRPPA